MNQKTGDILIGIVIVSIILFFILNFALILDHSERTEIRDELKELYPEERLDNYCTFKYGLGYKKSYDNDAGFYFCSTISKEGKLEKIYFTKIEQRWFKDQVYCKENYYWRFDDC